MQSRWPASYAWRLDPAKLRNHVAAALGEPALTSYCSKQKTGGGKVLIHIASPGRGLYQGYAFVRA
jgi:hypothetical protein